MIPEPSEDFRALIAELVLKGQDPCYGCGHPARMHDVFGKEACLAPSGCKCLYHRDRFAN